MNPPTVFRDEQRVGDCVRHLLVWKELLRAALRHVLVALRATRQIELPHGGVHQVERNHHARQAHQQPVIAAAERERRDDAHLRAGSAEDARVDSLDARMNRPAVQLFAADAWPLVEHQHPASDVLIGLRHLRDGEHAPIFRERGEPSRDAWVDAEKDHQPDLSTLRA